jgi:hypothetical protein
VLVGLYSCSIFKYEFIVCVVHSIISRGVKFLLFYTMFYWMIAKAYGVFYV